MPLASSECPDTFAVAHRLPLGTNGLSPTEAAILRRIRRYDRDGSGCRLTVAELGQADAARPLSERQTRRALAKLLAKGYVADLGRAPGAIGPRILSALPRRDVPAASQHNAQ